MGESAWDTEAPGFVCYSTFSEFSAFALHHSIRKLTSTADLQANVAGKVIQLAHWLLGLCGPKLCRVMFGPKLYLQKVRYVVDSCCRLNRVGVLTKELIRSTVGVLDSETEVATSQSQRETRRVSQ